MALLMVLIFYPWRLGAGIFFQYRTRWRLSRSRRAALSRAKEHSCLPACLTMLVTSALRPDRLNMGNADRPQRQQFFAKKRKRCCACIGVKK